MAFLISMQHEFKIGKLQAHALRFLNRHYLQDLDDVVQEAILAAIQSKNHQSIEGYVMGTVRIIAMRRATRRRFVDRRSVPLNEARDHARVTESQPDREAQYAALERLVSRLGPRMRMHFAEWEANGFQCRDHAEECKVSRLRSALIRMHKLETDNPRSSVRGNPKSMVASA